MVGGNTTLLGSYRLFDVPCASHNAQAYLKWHESLWWVEPLFRRHLQKTIVAALLFAGDVSKDSTNLAWYSTLAVRST